jgi:hypothetical protein
MFGSLLSFFSVAAGIGMAALTATIIDGDAGFPVGGAAATATYLLVVGLEMLGAREEESRS